MFFVKAIYDIFQKSSDREERFEEIRKKYIADHLSEEKKETDRKWGFISPLVRNVVELEFKVNTIAECSTRGKDGGSQVFVHLEEDLFENKELITLLLAIANVWDEKVYVYRHFHTKAYNDTILKFIKENRSSFWYEGDLIKEIVQACGYNAPNISDKLVDGYYYHYLYIDYFGAPDNISHSGWGTEVYIKKVIVW